jgi:DNA-binding phage protein
MINISIMESIGKDIDALIQKKGLSRYRVSKDIGVSQESLLRSLKEDANPRWKTIKKVLDYLGYEVILRPKRKEVKPEKPKPFRSGR